jgi:hypothetical protein
VQKRAGFLSPYDSSADTWGLVALSASVELCTKVAASPIVKLPIASVEVGNNSSC